MIFPEGAKERTKHTSDQARGCLLLNVARNLYNVGRVREIAKSTSIFHGAPLYESSSCTASMWALTHERMYHKSRQHTSKTQMVSSRLEYFPRHESVSIWCKRTSRTRALRESDWHSVILRTGPSMRRGIAMTVSLTRKQNETRAWSVKLSGGISNNLQ